MERFQIRTFRGATLEKVETVEAPDLLEVIERASRSEKDLTAEIWSRIGKVGMIGPIAEQPGEAKTRPGESEITGVMKCRLRLVRG